MFFERDQLIELVGLLSEAKGDGYGFVTYPRGKEEYFASDFELGLKLADAREAALSIEFAKVVELQPLLTRLERCLERDYAEQVIVADYASMGLEGGNISIDLERMGMRIPVVEQRVSELAGRWGDIDLDRQIGRFHIGMKMHRVEIDGQFRIPEYAILVPKLLGEEEVMEHYVAEVRALEEDFKRTIGAEIPSGPFVGDGELSVQEMGGRCIDFLLWTHEFPEEDFEQRCKIVSGLCQGYPVGKEVELSMYTVHPELQYKLYHHVQFPNTFNVERAVEMIIDVEKMKLTAREAYLEENLKKAIMEAKNLENLKNEMAALGFSENLIGQMEAKMAANEPRFILYDQLQTDKGRMEVGVHFNQSKSSEYYYLNKYDLVLEKQPPLEAGEKYMVASQRQGEEVQVREFEMASLAVKHFNMKLEGAKEIRGTAQIFSGVDLDSAKQLVSMKDGEIIHLEKDFYKTLKNPAPGQTIYLEKGNGFTLEQSANMLLGRSVERDNILDINKHEYSAWAKFDFDAGRERNGNFPIKTFTEGYGFDLSAVLDRFDFKELADPKLREAVESSMRNGNRAEVSVEVNGKTEKLLAVAVPEFKQINLYSLDGQSIKRETHLKAEVGAEVALGKEKGQRKGKAAEQGLGV